MNTGEHLWMIPHGDTDRRQQEAFRNNPLLKGVTNLDTNWGRRGHAALAASSTLLFATGQTADNRRTCSAIDKKTGKRVGAVADAAPGRYGLMTYLHSGKQYIVIADQRRLHGDGVAVSNRERITKNENDREPGPAMGPGFFVVRLFVLRYFRNGSRRRS